MRNAEIDVDDFVDLFRGDEYQQKILTVLNNEIKRKQEVEEYQRR